MQFRLYLRIFLNVYIFIGQLVFNKTFKWSFNILNTYVNVFYEQDKCNVNLISNFVYSIIK